MQQTSMQRARRAGFRMAVAVAALAPAMAWAQEQVLTKEYDNGGVYQGTFVDGRQHGQGSYRLPSGYAYEGEWIEGRIEGDGRATFPNGSVYVGHFLAGQPDGKGKITYPDGGSYEGDWKAGRIEGQGVATYANGASYTGTFVAGKQQGEGTLSEPDGSSYAGGWADGVKQGKGKISYPDGAVFEGDMAAGAPEGRGKLTTADGTSYEGAWKAGKFDGDGVLAQANGDRYEGAFKEGRREGLGRVTTAAGDVYDGGFVADQRHGAGTLTATDGFRYTGDWVRGRFEGDGKATYPDGSVYEGAFAAGLPDGRGKIVYADGRSFEGDWVAGAISGQGIARYAGGLTYEGGFKEGRNEGQGKLVSPEGYSYDGGWADGQRQGAGVAVYADGTRYEGGFARGQRSGRGKMTMADGVVFDGLWEEGLLNGEGRAVYADGSVYEGMFEDGRRQGQGKMRLADGREFSGLWKDGQLENSEAVVPDARRDPGGAGRAPGASAGGAGERVLGVAHRDQRQAVGRRHRAAGAARARGERLCHPPGGPGAGADPLQRADDPPHLVVQERARPEAEAVFAAGRRLALLDGELVEGADRALRLAGGGAEGGEVVPPDQRRRRLAHGGGVERMADAPGEAAVAHQRRAAGDDAEEVGALDGVEAGVKAGRHLGRRHHRHRLRPEMRVDRGGEAPGVPGALEVDMGHLPERVHAGIGPPRSEGHRRLGSDARDRRLQRALHARMRGLALPAREGPAVVLDPEGIARHAAYSVQSSTARMSSSDQPRWWAISWTSTWLHQPVERHVAAVDPLLQDRAAVEPDRVGPVGLHHHRALGERDAVVEAGQLVGILDLEVVQHVVGREVVHPEQEVGAGAADRRGQAVEGAAHQPLEVGQRRGGGAERIGGHGVPPRRPAYAGAPQGERGGGARRAVRPAAVSYRLCRAHSGPTRRRA